MGSVEVRVVGTDRTSGLAGGVCTGGRGEGEEERVDGVGQEAR